MKPQTILYAHPSDELYGADRVILYLVERLDPAVWRPIFVLPSDLAYEGELSALLKKKGIPVLHMNLAILRRKYFTPLGLLGMAWRLLHSTLVLRALIRKESVTMVHSTTTAVLSGAFAARLAAKPHIWHVHEILVKPRFLWKTLSWLIPRMSDRVVAVSGPTRGHLCMGDRLNESRCMVLHNGIEYTPFRGEALGARLREEWRGSAGAPLVGMIGRISTWKGQDHFLTAARKLSETHPSARFVIVGGTIPGQEDLLERVKGMIREFGLEARVILSDFRKDIPEVLGALDVFVLPSTLPDPFPTVILEAMAAGKPVVANAHGGSTEMVVDGETGFLVPPTSPDVMAEKIGWLLDHPELAESMGKAGQARQAGEFSIQAYVRKWSEVYSALAKNPSQSVSGRF